MPFKTASGKLFYRIGDVIISTNNENPSKIYGGSWQLLCPGKTLVCIDTSDSDFNIVKKVGGNKYLQSHNHNGTVENAGSHGHSATIGKIDNHSHLLTYSYKYNQGSTGYDFARISTGTVSGRNATYYTEPGGSHTHSITINGTGEHNHRISINNSGSGNSQNLQPYMVVYMWVRVS